MLVELPTGQSARITVSITNTSALIDAYSVRAFGLDPQWMDVSTDRLSLFPSEVGTVDVGVALPADFPAGLRQMAIHVQSENDPAEFALAQITLDVGTRSRTTLRVDPVSVTGGNKAQFALVIANQGNSTVQARPEGVDPEDKVDIGFEPPTVVLPPGRREVVQANIQGGRPWFGQPKPRVLSFSLGADSPPVMATFLQRARIGRWLISLLGLATVAAVFALVLSTVMDDLVAESKTDEALLDEALADEDGRGRRERVGHAELDERAGGPLQRHRGGGRAGGAVLVRKRRRSPGERGHRSRRNVRVRPAQRRPLPAPVHRRRLRRAVVRRRRSRSPTPRTSRYPSMGT